MSSYYVFLIVAAGGCCVCITCAALICKAHTPICTRTPTPETNLQLPTESLSLDTNLQQSLSHHDLVFASSRNLPPINDGSAVMENTTHGEM